MTDKHTEIEKPEETVTPAEPTSTQQIPIEQDKQQAQQPEQPAKKPKRSAKQWVKFAIVTAPYLAFLYWVESWLGLLGLPFI